MRLGHRKWPRKPGGKLSTLRLYRPLHLPDIHRLSAIAAHGADPVTYPSERLPSTSAHYHGFILDFATCAFPLAVDYTCSFQCDHSGLQCCHSICLDIARLSPSRPVLVNADHPRSA